MERDVDRARVSGRPASRARSAGARLPVVVLLAVALPWLAYCPDDLFIHLRFAANLAARGEWAFNPGQPVAGATSPPWVLLLAAAARLGLPLVAVAKGLALAAAMTLVLLAMRLAARLAAPAVLAYEDYHRRTLLAAAAWLAGYARPDDLVLTGDIGVVGYLSGVWVLDPAGIVNPDAPRWAGAGSTFAEIAARRPRFALNPMWRPGFDPALLDRFTLERVFVHRHGSYRLGGDGAFEVTLRVLDWGRGAGTP